MLPATTSAAPLFSNKAFAAFWIPAFKVASEIPVTPPPLTALNKAAAIAPVSEGRCKYFSSAFEPVRLATLSKCMCLLMLGFFSLIFLPVAYCLEKATGLNQVPKKSAPKLTIAFAFSKW